MHLCAVYGYCLCVCVCLPLHMKACLCFRDHLRTRCWSRSHRQAQSFPVCLVNADEGDYVMETPTLFGFITLSGKQSRTNQILCCVLAWTIWVCVCHVLQKSGLNPVHLCPHEAKEFLLGLILPAVFSPLLNLSFFSLPFSLSPANPPLFIRVPLLLLWFFGGVI